VAGGTISGDNQYDGLFTYDITSSGVVVPSSYKSKIFSQGSTRFNMKGIEFSPDGNLIYFTNTSNSFYTKSINCIDVASWSLVSLGNIPNAQAADFKFSQLELAQDRKIYAVTNNRLATINNPDNGSGATWTNSALGLTNYNLSI